MDLLKTFNDLLDKLREEVFEVTKMGKSMLQPAEYLAVKEISKILLRLLSATRDMANINIEAATSLAVMLEIIIRKPWLTNFLSRGAIVLNETLHNLPVPSEEAMKKFVEGKRRVIKVVRSSEKQDPIVNLFNSAYSDKPVPFKELIDELEGRKTRKL